MIILFRYRPHSYQNFSPMLKTIYFVTYEYCLHCKIIWWKGYGAYIGSANLTGRAWYSNIEAGVFYDENDLYNTGLIEQLEEFFDNLSDLDSLPPCIELTKEIIQEQQQLQKLKLEQEKKEQANHKKTTYTRMGWCK